LDSAMVADAQTELVEYGTAFREAVAAQATFEVAESVKAAVAEMRRKNYTIRSLIQFVVNSPEFSAR